MVMGFDFIVIVALLLSHCGFFFVFGCGVSFLVNSSVFLFLFLINLFIYLFYFWLCWVFIAARGLSLVVVSRNYSLLQCAGFSLWWLLFVAEHGL